jgi:hypothetical protein
MLQFVFQLKDTVYIVNSGAWSDRQNQAAFLLISGSRCMMYFHYHNSPHLAMALYTIAGTTSYIYNQNMLLNAIST